MNPCEEFEKAYWADIAEPPDLQMLQDCLKYAKRTNGPLPAGAMEYLVHNIDRLLRGHDSLLLSKARVRVDTSEVNYCKSYAVSYIKTSRKHRKHDYDSKPIKTVSEMYGVDERTVQNWQKQFPDASDDLDKAHMLGRLRLFGFSYSKLKKI